mgnify:CR=1 FL=1
MELLNSGRLLSTMAAEKKKRTKAPRNPEAHGADAPNPVWFKPVMFGFMLIGLVWIIVFYISQGTLPIWLSDPGTSWSDSALPSSAS